jgi:iron complex outermembrane receptor protein
MEFSAGSNPVSAQTIQELQQLSIEQLGNIEITSVSKQPQRLSSAAAAIYVITHDDIMRSGAITIPEILRLAPNLFVAQVSPDQYVITARGLSGNFNAQNFSNKCLVLVYSPLFSGVYWDTINVLPEDIERIEVISGPGGTLWGANAVNGVINIITRKAADTQGGILEVGAGNYQNSASLQYGGKSGDDLAYRIYAGAIDDRSMQTTQGTSAHDGYWEPQGGFRLDWTPSADQVSVEGNYYYGSEEQLGASDAPVEGRNLQASWQHDLGGDSSLQILSYYDESRRSVQGGGAGFSVSTYDFQAQENFTLLNWNNITWGAEERVVPYDVYPRIGAANSLYFQPAGRVLNLADAFVQDQIALPAQLTLTLGIKVEDDPYSGVAPMPTARLAWQPFDGNLLWTGISRAIRSPTPFDEDVVEKAGSTTFLTGNTNFLPEDLVAYEAGYRGQLSDQLSVSLSSYYNFYGDLRSIELSPSTGFLPLEWGNMVDGHEYGLEAWGDFRATDWWKLTAGVDVLRQGFHFALGASQLLGLAQVGDDPHHQAMLRSSMNLGQGVTLDADLRYVGELPDPRVPQYVELNARIRWAITDNIEISLSGFNLLHPQHQEYTFPGSDEIKRNFFIDTRWKF